MRGKRSVNSKLSAIFKVWIILKERMNAEKEHRIPLSQQASSLLKSIQEHTQPQDCIFPMPRNATIFSDICLTTLIKHMHEQKLKENSFCYIDSTQNRVIITYSFRSNFRD